MITDAAKEYTGRELTMKGDVDLAIGLPPTLEVNDVAFQNAPWGSQPQMARLKKLRVQVAILPLIMGNLTIKQLIIEEPVFLLEINKSGKSNLDFDVAKTATPTKAEEKSDDEIQREIELNEIDIKNGKITYKDHRTGQTDTVDLASLVLTTPLLGGGADIHIKGSFNKTPFDINGNIGLISKALKSNEKWPLKIKAQAVKTKISAEGSIQDLRNARGIDLKLNIEGDDLAEFEKFTGEPLPLKGPFKVSGEFKSPSEKVVEVSDLLVELGESQIQGSVKVTHAASRPYIEARLSSKQLDLGKMAKDLGVSDAVAGKLNIDLDLRGQGNSVAAIMAGLNGDTKILMSNGKINNRYADLIGGDLRASLTSLFNPLAEKQEYATLNCVVNHFEIKNGLAQSRVLVIDSNRMTVVGEGDINLKTEALDLGVMPEPKEGLGAGNVATVNVSLSEFTKPFRLKGTLANPSLGIDPTKTVLTFGKTIGGIALFGPAGLATSFVSGKFGENHPCAKSLAALGDEEKAAKKKESGGIGSRIKNLFGKPKK